MAYGPQTKSVLTGLSRNEYLNAAARWSPDQFTLPFSDRLYEFAAEYRDLPPAPDSRKAALTALINQGAASRGVKIARNTLNEWLSEMRDPSVSSSDANTRENIYRLCAALDLDLELTEELFEKVFFSCAFTTKNLKELCFLYHAQADARDGAEGCRWYGKGEALWQAVLSAQTPDGGRTPPLQSHLILECADTMDEAEFRSFLLQNGSAFSRENQFERARAKIIELASLASGCDAADSPAAIAYEPLLNHILDYAQRGAPGSASCPVSSLRALPAQLTTNFPTGQILRKICLGQACTYDQFNKMLALLLFYHFHVHAPDIPVKARFDAFLRFANLSLGQVGFSELYPCQPYGGLLLYCAAQENPLTALRAFIRRAAESESESALKAKLRQNLNLQPELCKSVIRAAERDPFLVRLVIGTLRRSACPVRTLEFPAWEEYENPSDELLQYLCVRADFSPLEEQVLYCCALLPADGMSDTLLHRMFSEQEYQTALALEGAGWLNRRQDVWSMDYRIRKTVANQDYAREYYDSFLKTVRGLAADSLSAGDQAQLRRILKRKPL